MYSDKPEIDGKKQQILLSFVYIHIPLKYTRSYRFIVYSVCLCIGRKYLICVDVDQHAIQKYFLSALGIIGGR